MMQLKLSEEELDEWAERDLKAFTKHIAELAQGTAGNPSPALSRFRWLLKHFGGGTGVRQRRIK